MSHAFSQYPILLLMNRLHFLCFSSVFSLLCLCVCVFALVYLYLCVRVNACVCTCLFCLVVPTVLARKWSPPSWTHPGGVRLCRLGGGHHQQNISDLQCSAGTVIQESYASSWKLFINRKEQKQHLCWSGFHVVFLLCCPFFATFVTCLSSSWWSQQAIYSVTVHLTHPTHTPACPFKLCRGRVILFFDYATALVIGPRCSCHKNVFLDSLRNFHTSLKR